MVTEFFSPLSNVTPFTYRDAETYLEQLKRLRGWIDDSNTVLTANLNKIILEFDAGMAAATTAAEAAELSAKASEAYALSMNNQRLIPARSVRDVPYNAVGDGIVDDAAAIQATIDAAAATVLASGMAQSPLVYIPAGHYRITETIHQPTYVKVVAQGSVTIESEIPDGPAWVIAPLESDPDRIYEKLGKQQWMRGFIFSGDKGAFTFINTLTERGDTVCLELGATSNLGELSPLARYALSDVSIQNYHIGVQWNTFNHYIATYYRFQMEQNDICVRYGTGAVQQNSGENINWVDSIFAVGDTAHLFDSDNIDVGFRGCSIDFMTTGFLFNQGWNRVYYQGHLEGLNDGPFRTPTGGIAVSNVTPDNTLPTVSIEGRTPFVAADRGPFFRGFMYLDWNGIYRYNGDFTNQTLDSSSLCDSKVIVGDVKMIAGTAGGWSTISRTLNNLSNGRFRGHPNNTDLNTLGEDWVLGTYEGIESKTVTSINPPSTGEVGDQSIAITYPEGAAGYLNLDSVCKMPVRAGEVIHASCGYYVPVAGKSTTISATFTFYNSEDAIIFETNPQPIPFQFFKGQLIGTWAAPDGPVTKTAPPGTAYVKVSFTMSCNNGAGSGIAFQYSDFNAYVA